MWFLFALLTALAWGAADLFYKKGSDSNDKLTHLKIVIMVGFVMGIHALGYMLYNGINFDPFDMVRYLPVSALYILSMVFGYIGLRYLMLSVSSPIQNSSGAITAILLLIFFPQSLGTFHYVGMILITIGVIGIAIVEKQVDDKLLKASGTVIDRKYRLGVIAIIFPILYAVLDSLGTFADGIYLDEMQLISEDAALLAYEFTFFICAVIAFIYVKFIKKDNYNVLTDGTRLSAAIFETAGQFFYVFAMADHAVVAAPLVASYCIFSVIFSRIFLKEKLSAKHYFVIIIVIIGIITMGIADEL